MRAFSAEALILRTYRYGEADRIVVFLTEDRGKRRGVAKNATNSRRRFGAGLEPLTLGRVAYVERETRDLVRLDRVEPQSSPLAGTMGQTGGAAAHVLGHAAYFAELLDEWSPDGAPNERLYRLGVAVVGALGRGGSVDALARYFEYWLMRLEGVYPALDVCPRCEQASFGEGATLVMAERAYICGPCAGGGAKLSAEAMAFLRHTVRRTPTEAVNAPVGTGALREIEQAHARLIAMHLEKELQSARVVRELRPES